MDIAKDYEEKTGKIVYAAINGDYFSGGIPVDFYAVDNNILRIGPYSYTLDKNSFGFNQDHEFNIGKVEYGYKINLLNDNVRSVSEIIGTYVYRIGLQGSEFSFATAVGLFNSVVALFMILAGNFITKKFFNRGLW